MVLGPDKPVNAITSDDIQTYIDSQARLRSANAANKDRKNLSAMWTYGQDILNLHENPVLKTKKHSHDVAQQETYTEDEVLKLLMAANRHESIILKTFLETAGRRNEIWRLKWDDVNIERHTVRLWTRKTKDGSLEGEWLPISDELASEFKWLWDQTDQENSWVFPNPRTGLPYIDPRKWYFRLCDRAGVRKIGFHAFRRYVASILDDKFKASRKSIQKLLRHKKESTTERYLYQIHSDLKDLAGLAIPNEKVPESSTPNEQGVNDENR
jgi:integrase